MEKEGPKDGKKLHRDSTGRRRFLKQLTSLALSVASTEAGIELFKVHPVMADLVEKEDPRLVTENIKYRGATGDITAKFFMPKIADKLPGVIVIHENRGLNAHIEDVTRRVALEGFLALAPDALSPMGGTPKDEAKAIAMIGQLDQKKTIENFVAAVKYLKTHPKSNGKIGVIGFCWGGGMANQLAVNSPDLDAAVPYYGRQPATEDVQKIKASLLLHYASNDEMINKGIASYEEALKKAHIDYRLYIYEGTQHAFNNDTNPSRYNKQAAALAWRRTIDFLKEKLR